MASKKRKRSSRRSSRRSRRSPHRYGNALTPTIAKAIKRFNKFDKAAHEKVGEYVHRYMRNRGLVATYPKLSYSFMKVWEGHPVYNQDGGSDIAFFSSPEAAHTSLVAWEQATRKEIGGH
jgi:hypothetical protein